MLSRLISAAAEHTPARRAARAAEQKAAAARIEAERAALADELELWLRSPIGAYFSEQIARDKSATIRTLLQTPHSDAAAILKAQSDHAMLERIQGYMVRIIQNARREVTP